MRLAHREHYVEKGLIGHAHALTALPTPVPASVLITGPEGVGKSLVAQRVAARTGVNGMDLLNAGVLTVDASRRIVAHVTHRPLRSRRRVAVAELAVAGKGVNAILKVLEEPPLTACIILHSSLPVPLTVSSRCHRIQCGTLTTEEVTDVLMRELGWEAAPAIAAAKVSGGRVSAALKAEQVLAAKTAVLSVVRAVETSDTHLLDSIINGLVREGTAHEAVLTEVVYALLTEVRTGRYAVFTAVEASGLARAGNRRLDRALKTLGGGAAPKLAVRTALTSLV